MTSNIVRQQGMTVIELIVIIIILTILAVTAAPKFLEASSTARANVVKNIAATLTSQHKYVMQIAQMPGRKIVVSGRTWIDMNGNSVADVDSATNQDGVEGNDGIDILTSQHNDFAIDNYQVHKLLDSYDGIEFDYVTNGNRTAYIGFDLNNDGDIRNDNCRAYFTEGRREILFQIQGC